MKYWSSKLRSLRCRLGLDRSALNICWAQWLLLIAFLALFLAGCGGEDPDGEVAIRETIVAATVAAIANNPPDVEQPQADSQSAEGQPKEEQPAADVPVEPVVDVAATEAADALRLTAEAEAAAAAAAQAEREAMLEPIRAEVASYGIDPNQGDLGFTHPPITIEVTDFEDAAFRNQNLFTVARDFVLAADVTWNSAYAESGCGFAVRNDGNDGEGDSEEPSQYIIGLTRGAEGHLLFAEQVKGEVDLNLVTDIYANGIDPKFEWQNDTTNRIAVVGRGQEFTFYSNGTRLGSVTAKAGFEEGFVAFIAVNRSGGIRCDFNNAWLWRMN